MCGIVGYIGKRRAAPILIDGLKRLEYRGYDSAGIAVMNDGRVEVFKRCGRVEQLEPARTLSGSIGIGHTRWATHGAPNSANAHPHTFGEITLVHNGIIENAAQLRAQCLRRGESFLSETDSEVAAHVIADFYRETKNLLQSVWRACQTFCGSYALAVMAAGKEEIVCARRASPLIVAKGDGEAFVASDMALGGAKRQIFVLEDGEFARLTGENLQIYDKDLALIAREGVFLQQSEILPEKREYRHFMRKEMDEIPEAVENSLISPSKFEKSKLSEVLCQAYYIDIVACGTAYHSGLCAQYAFEKLLRIPTRVFLASEYRYLDPIIAPGTLTIAISQSGETADTLAAAQLAVELGSKVLAVTNVAHSSLTRVAHLSLLTNAGREVAVAATKSFQAQLALLYSLFGEFYGRKDFSASLSKMPSLARMTMQSSECVSAWTPYFLCARSVFFLGRGVDRCTALEGSLKLKEITYLPSEGYAAGELKHGTLALVDEHTPVVAVITDEALADKTMNAVHEVSARGARVFLVTNLPELCHQPEVTASVLIPKCEACFSPILSVIPLQLLSYHLCLALGKDPDKPRNLAKSVTVE